MRLGLGVAAGPDAEQLASIAREAEAMGYAATWSNDHPVGDGLLQLSVWARNSDAIQLCVGVLALDRRRPSEIAAEVAELALPRDRLLLGVGAGLQPSQLGAVREGVGELRRLLPGVRLAIAAMGPKMCALAGELADVVLLNWMTPERIAWAIPRVQAGAEAAGKPPVEVDAYIRVAMGPGAAERLAGEADFYAQMPAYARNFEASGAPPGSVGIAVQDAGELPAALADYAALDGAVLRPLSNGTPGAILEIAGAAIAPV